MNKKLVSLATVLCLGVGVVGGCSKDKNKFKTLHSDGHDIVLTLGNNTKYTADELFNDMLLSEAGVKAAYEKILKMMVENSIATDANMEASWELMLEKFEETVETNSATNGTSKKEERKKMLTEEGYASIEEKKEAYLYEVKLAKLKDNYWKERKDYYFEQYFNARLPYYVKHILVKTSYSSSRGPYATVIDSDDAKDLYDVYSLLAKGEKFAYVMNHKSEDSTDGNGYHMDLTTSFVTEFLHGVFALDAMLKDQESKVQGLTSNVLEYYINNSGTTGDKNDYNFNVIYAEDIEALGKHSSSSDYNSVTTYKNDGENKNVEFGKLTNSSEYGSISALYARSVIFNQTFNNPGISVISLGNDFSGENYMELTIDGKTHKLLTDEKGNLVFIACAKGSSSDLWVHFLTVDVSPFDENAKLFYSFDQEGTIEKMVASKKEQLQTNNTMSEDEINNTLNEYREELEAYQTYVDIKGGEKQTNRNTIIDELEGYVKTYAQRGITSGAVESNEQFLTYDMVEYYMNNGDVTISNTVIKNLIENYIQSQKDLIDLKATNSIVNGWNEYYARVALANSDEIVNKKIPMECAYALNVGATCKYNYDEVKGFEIVITYKNSSDNSTSYMPTDSSKYVSSFKIGDSLITLPTAGADSTMHMHRDGYTFDGWYYTSTFDEGTEVTTIDPSRTSSSNKVVVYAKWTKN